MCELWERPSAILDSLTDEEEEDDDDDDFDLRQS